MTVKKVADRCGVTGETLRYYERIGMLPPVTRTAGGIRDYTAEDLKWVGPMLCMRKAGLRPEAIIEYVRLYREGAIFPAFARPTASSAGLQRCCSSKRACTRCSPR